VREPATLRLNKVSHVAVARTMCHAGTRVRDPYRSFIRATMETGSDRAGSSLLFRREQKKQERWEETFNYMTSRTQAAKREAPSTNSLACLNAPLACASSRQTSSSRNLEERSTQHREPPFYQAYHQGAVQPMEGHSTVTLTLSDQRSLKAFGSGFHLLVVYAPRWVGSHILVLRFPQSSLPAHPNSKFQRS